MNEASEPSKARVIEAAGGVVERRTADGLFIALIRRDRHGHEWALPKGKRVKGESWQEAARREVLEETGVKATPLSIAGCTSYVTGSAPKIVVYCQMKLERELDVFTPNEETKELRWLRPEEAVRLLTHNEERQLLRSIFRLSPEDRSRWIIFQRISQWRRWWLRAKPLQRLATSIHAYEFELSGRAERSQSPPESLRVLQTVLGAAGRATDDGRLEEGWKCLLTAQRLEILYLNDADLQAAALAIQHEATKLNTWRKAAVLDLLAPTCGTPVTTDRVFKAAALRDEHYHNEAYKDSLRRANALMLALCLVLAIAMLLWEAKHGEFRTLEATWSDKAFGLRFIALVALVGLLGANVSAITDLAQEQVSARIPEMVSTFRVTVLRLFIGSASAIFLFFLARAGLLPEIFNGYAMLAFAFAAGFSERLVLRVVRSIVDRGERSS